MKRNEGGGGRGYPPSETFDGFFLDKTVEMV